MANLNEPIQNTPTTPGVDPLANPEPGVTDSPPPFTATTPPPGTSSNDDVRSDNVRVEEFKIDGDALVGKVRELLHQGNIRRIIIKGEDGHTLLEIPLTVGVVGGVVAAAAFPVLAALGVVGALVTRLSVVIERKV